MQTINVLMSSEKPASDIIENPAKMFCDLWVDVEGKYLLVQHFPLTARPIMW
jgi:hypothetical protein